VAEATAPKAGPAGRAATAGKRRRLAAGGFAQVQALVLRQVRQPAGEGAQVFLEQAAAGILQQPLHDGERLQFHGAEPQAGQFIRVGLRAALVEESTGLGVVHAHKYI
jgi:uncharacterized glyoxalase superfamily metalloenzyme YdcJ